MKIGDLFWGVRAETKGLDTDLNVAAIKSGDKAGKTLGQRMGASLRKSFSGPELGKGLVQGLGLAGGLGIGKALAGGLGAVKDAFTESIAKAMSFERGMLNINSIAKVSQAELKSMGKTVLAMSGEFGQSADTMTSALYDINSSGFAGAQGLDVLRASSKAATAGLATTAEAASGITAVLNSYGLKASDSARVSDVLFKTVERGVVTFPELSAEIGKTTALASPLGVSIEEVGAALAVMTRHGLGAEDATTQLNAIMASMLKPSAEAAELAGQLGLNWSAAGLKAKGLVGQLKDMIKKTGGADDEMAVLLGDARAIRGAFSLAAEGGGELNRELAIMEKAAGATDAAFGVQSQGAAFKMAQAQAKLDAAMISFGEGTLPIVSEGMDRFVRGAGRVGDALAAIDKATLDVARGTHDLLTFWTDEQATRDEAARLLALKDAMAATAHMADASKDDLVDIAVVEERIGTNAAEAATAFKTAMEKIYSAAVTAKTNLTAAGQETADGFWDPQILKMQMAATEREISEQKQIVASKDSTAEQIADAQLRLAELRKTTLEQILTLASYGDEQGQTMLETQIDILSKTKNLSDSEILQLNRLKAALIALQRTAKQTAALLYMASASKDDTIPGHASGGTALAYNPTWVGEGGKELLIPTVDSTILSHGDSMALASGVGASGSGNTFNIYNPEPRAADADIGRMLRRAAAMGLG